MICANSQHFTQKQIQLMLELLLKHGNDMQAIKQALGNPRNNSLRENNQLIRDTGRALFYKGIRKLEDSIKYYIDCGLVKSTSQQMDKMCKLLTNRDICLDAQKINQKKLRNLLILIIQGKPIQKEDLIKGYDYLNNFKLKVSGAQSKLRKNKHQLQKKQYVFISKQKLKQIKQNEKQKQKQNQEDIVKLEEGVSKVQLVNKLQPQHKTQQTNLTQQQQQISLINILIRQGNNFQNALKTLQNNHMCFRIIKSPCQLRDRCRSLYLKTLRFIQQQAKNYIDPSKILKPSVITQFYKTITNRQTQANHQKNSLRIKLLLIAKSVLRDIKIQKERVMDTYNILYNILAIQNKVKQNSEQQNWNKVSFKNNQNSSKQPQQIVISNFEEVLKKLRQKQLNLIEKTRNQNDNQKLFLEKEQKKTNLKPIIYEKKSNKQFWNNLQQKQLCRLYLQENGKNLVNIHKKLQIIFQNNYLKFSPRKIESKLASIFNHSLQNFIKYLEQINHFQQISQLIKTTANYKFCQKIFHSPYIKLKLFLVRYQLQNKAENADEINQILNYLIEIHKKVLEKQQNKNQESQEYQKNTQQILQQQRNFQLLNEKYSKVEQ